MTIRVLCFQIVAAVAVLSSGCTSEEEALPDSSSDTGASGEDAPIDNADASDVLDGSGPLAECAGGVCAAPCTARYLVRYSQELDCISAREEWDPRPDAPGILFSAVSHQTQRRARWFRASVTKVTSAV